MSNEYDFGLSFGDSAYNKIRKEIYGPYDEYRSYDINVKTNPGMAIDSVSKILARQEAEIMELRKQVESIRNMVTNLQHGSDNP